jgi:hypothetical protein
LIQYGSVGLIAANCLSMVNFKFFLKIQIFFQFIRIAICIFYLQVRILPKGGFKNFITKSYPKPKFFILFFITFAISFFVTHQFKEKIFLQIIVGGGISEFFSFLY